MASQLGGSQCPDYQSMLWSSFEDLSEFRATFRIILCNNVNENKCLTAVAVILCWHICCEPSLGCFKMYVEHGISMHILVPK